jgi:hypothetical protein
MQLTHKLLLLLPMRRELKENRVCSERKREREDTERDRERAV